MASSSRAVNCAKEKEENTSRPNWLELPRDVTAMILRKLDTMDLLKGARNVCPLWWNICKDPLMWRTLDFSKCSGFRNKCYYYVVDLSRGLLQDITLGPVGSVYFPEHPGPFASDHLLQHIANNTSQLRCLRTGFAMRRIKDKVWSEVAVKWPLLEELDLSFCYVSNNSLEAIGRSCPNLRVLKFKQHELLGQKDGAANAIAKIMSYSDDEDEYIDELDSLSGDFHNWGFY